MAYPFPTFPVQGSRLVSEFRGDFNQMLDAILQSFTGPDEPSPTFAGMFWVDTSADPALFKQRNSSNTGWAIRAQVAADNGGVLPLTGGTMSGPIAMGGQALTGLPLGSGDAPARYSDLAAYAPLTGATFASIPELPAADPSTDNQAARKAYVDDRVVAGGAYTGQITMSTPPSADAHVTTKSYVDGAFDVHNHDGTSGRGPVLQAANLGAAGRDLGDRLQAVGDGSVEWVEGNPFQVLDQPILAANATFSTLGWTHSSMTWNILDLGAIAPANARHALISVNGGNIHSRPQPVWHKPQGSDAPLPSWSGVATLNGMAFGSISAGNYAPMAVPEVLGLGLFFQFWVELEPVEKEVELAFGELAGPSRDDGSTSAFRPWDHHDNVNEKITIYVYAWN